MSEEMPIYGNEPTYVVTPPGKEGLTLNEYQLIALRTANYPPRFKVIYPALGMNGEAGEVADKVKKIIRDKEARLDSDDKRAIALEIGDVLWCCATMANDLGYTLQEIAEMNRDKLHSRQLRGKLGGSGDER